MRLPAFTCFLFLLPTLLPGQTSDPLLDSLSRPLPADAIVRAQADQCTAVIWHKFINTTGKYNHWPTRLDSLFHCCIAGKTKDRRFEKTIDAEVDFYKGAEARSNVALPPDVASQFFESALTKYVALGDSLKMGWSNLSLSSIASALGDSLAFAKHYEQASRLSDFNKTPGDLAVFHNLCGLNCYYFGRYAEAASHYFKTLEAIDKAGSREARTLKHTVLHNLCGVYYQLGDFDNGERYIRMAIQSAIEEKIEPAFHYGLLAWCSMEKEDYREALSLLK